MVTCIVLLINKPPPRPVSNSAFSQEKHKENKAFGRNNLRETMGTEFHGQFLFGKSTEYVWAEFATLGHPCMSRVALFLKSPLHVGRHTQACPVSQCSFLGNVKGLVKSQGELLMHGFSVSKHSNEQRFLPSFLQTRTTLVEAGVKERLGRSLMLPED